MEILNERKIKKIITDRGGEFLNQRFKELSSKKGFQHNVAPPYTPEHNVIAEKANRMILDKERYLFLGSNLPHQYWPKPLTLQLTYLISFQLPQETISHHTTCGLKNRQKFKALGCFEAR
ncbi:hypothetical protein O181_090845 [Austropuccinia psidii MF-1]|uniref:Integrase catalytic domain-containing protein n=1 Tax=Austropuccinia psidii MF-1 TaxID=1389203 RepID=A0A9Q3IVS0_9BASI|nr:hypothetical protein [Austropuccinia psidii MF-1]